MIFFKKRNIKKVGQTKIGSTGLPQAQAFYLAFYLSPPPPPPQLCVCMCRQKIMLVFCVHAWKQHLNNTEDFLCDISRDYLHYMITVYSLRACMCFNVELLWVWLLWTLEQDWLYLGHTFTWKWNCKTDVIIHSCLLGVLLTYTEGYNAQHWKCPSKSTHTDAFTYAWNWFTFSGTSNERLCRICHEAEDDEELVSPCYCSGSVGLLHLTCLERWLGTSKLTRCEICKYEFTLKRLPRALTEVNLDIYFHH